MKFIMCYYSIDCFLVRTFTSTSTMHPIYNHQFKLCVLIDRNLYIYLNWGVSSGGSVGIVDNCF